MHAAWVENKRIKMNVFYLSNLKYDGMNSVFFNHLLERNLGQKTKGKLFMLIFFLKEENKLFWIISDLKIPKV